MQYEKLPFYLWISFARIEKDYPELYCGIGNKLQFSPIFFFCSAYIIIVLYLYGMKIKNVISLMSIDLQTFFRVSFFLLLLYSYGYLGFRVLSEKKESIKALLLINSSLHTLFESPEISTGQIRSTIFWYVVLKKM